MVHWIKKGTVVGLIASIGWSLWVYWRPKADVIAFEPPEISEIEIGKHSPYQEFIAVSTTFNPPRETLPTIAVLDSGLDLNVARREGLIALQPNSKTDILTDDLSHGTGIAILVAAPLNGFGMRGLVPHNPVLPIRLGNRAEFLAGKIPFSRLKKAFEDARKQRAKIINLSASDIEANWPKLQMDELLRKYSDLLIITAGGNDRREILYGPSCNLVPICNQAPNLIKVGAIGFDGSNWGEGIDVSVKGKVFVWHRIRYSPEGVRHYRLLERWSTSLAAPVLSAAASLIWAKAPGLTPENLKKLLVTHPSAQGLNLGQALSSVPKLHR